MIKVQVKYCLATVTETEEESQRGLGIHCHEAESRLTRCSRNEGLGQEKSVQIRGDNC